MALTIICVTGGSSTGKSTSIRQFTAEHLGYEKASGDVLGIFCMPYRDYAVGVNGYGDNLAVVRDGLQFLDRYKDLRVIIAACRSRGETFEEIQRFARAKKAIVLPPIETEKLDSAREWNAAIRENVARILRLMPRR
jgi:hypothetical protein